MESDAPEGLREQRLLRGMQMAVQWMDRGRMIVMQLHNYQNGGKSPVVWLIIDQLERRLLEEQMILRDGSSIAKFISAPGMGYIGPWQTNQSGKRYTKPSSGKPSGTEP